MFLSFVEHAENLAAFWAKLRFLSSRKRAKERGPIG
jgi:hypothetical protein